MTPEPSSTELGSAADGSVPRRASRLAPSRGHWPGLQLLFTQAQQLDERDGQVEGVSDHVRADERHGGAELAVDFGDKQRRGGVTALSRAASRQSAASSSGKA